MGWTFNYDYLEGGYFWLNIFHVSSKLIRNIAGCVHECISYFLDLANSHTLLSLKLNRGYPKCSICNNKKGKFSLIPHITCLLSPTLKRRSRITHCPNITSPSRRRFPSRSQLGHSASEMVLRRCSLIEDNFFVVNDLDQLVDMKSNFIYWPFGITNRFFICSTEGASYAMRGM